MAKKEGLFSKKQLTEHLMAVAQECETVDDEGNLVTNAEKLARVIWKKAVGYTETLNRGGDTVEKVHPPAAWAIQLLLDRIEGKVTATAEEREERLTAADRVGELAVNTLNRLAATATAPPPGPPPLKPRGGAGGE